MKLGPLYAFRYFNVFLAQLFNLYVYSLDYVSRSNLQPTAVSSLSNSQIPLNARIN